MYFGYSGHLEPPLFGYCIRLATINMATISGEHCGGQSDIVAKKWLPKVATIYTVDCSTIGGNDSVVDTVSIITNCPLYAGCTVAEEHSL